MSDKSESIVSVRPSGPEGAEPEANKSSANRKGFVEPHISQPVDVLEATTFFQTATSGAEF